MRHGLHIGTIVLSVFLGGCASCRALNPSLDISQYGHTVWTARDGLPVGAIFAMAQTPDGYMWLASEFGLFRFDGVHAVLWPFPAGDALSDRSSNLPYSLLVTRNGTLWIGTFGGLVSWNGKELTRYPGLGRRFVTSLLEDREGTIWAGTYGTSTASSAGGLCAIRGGRTECYDQAGAFGSFVWSIFQDRAGALWVGAETGVWRWKPGPPTRYPMPGMRVGDLIGSDDGHVLIGISGGGLRQVAEDRVEQYPIYNAIRRGALLPDREIDSNKLLRDRDGGLWIGTHQRGLVHIHNGRTDVFTKGDGLSGDISCSLFEDREGDVWYASSRGLDRFRELPVTTISAKEGLSSNYASSVVAGTDGSVWIGTHDGLTRWKNGQAKAFRRANGLPSDFVQSMFEDARGRLWAAFSGRGLFSFTDGSFTNVPGLPSEEVYSIGGDKLDDLWLSGSKGLSHVRDGRLVDTIPWSAMGRKQQAKVVIPDEGGVWLAFWNDGGVLYFRDGRVQASYTVADGLGSGPVADIQLDPDGTVWAATQEGGLSRIKNGHVTTLTTRNGLPCDTIHWSIEDDDRDLWMLTACGLVRVRHSEINRWIAALARRIETTVWDATDGVALTAASPGYFNPPAARSADGKLWFVADSIAVVDPHHIPFNAMPPPVHIEQIVADRRVYWRNLPGPPTWKLRLPARSRDVQIDFAALSLTAPEKVHFKYKLEGQDRDWREVINEREVQYSNLGPGSYQFRVIASNSSGVWNELGDTLEFSIAPAYYQTNWFRALCAVLLLAAVWAAWWWRLRQLKHQFEITVDARVAERTRIARDLHDTLLQSFQGVLLQFQAVSQLLPIRPIEAKEKLDLTIDKAADAVTEGRDAVQGLRTSLIENSDLASTLKALGDELAAEQAGATSPTFRVTLEGEPRNLHPILRDEIFSISAEALRNAFRHAEAGQVELEIRYDDQQFRLRVRDDGRGMDATVLSGQEPGGHFGLSGMRERATLAGGKLIVWSKPGAGTEVELRIPARAAYTAFHKHSRLFQMLAGK